VIVSVRIFLKMHSTSSNGMRCREWLQPRLESLTDGALFTRMVLPTPGIHISGHRKIHKRQRNVLVSTFLVNMWRGVSDINLAGPNAIEELLTAVCYRNFLEDESLLCLEDVQHNNYRKRYLL
jgi:hypothetical protein